MVIVWLQIFRIKKCQKKKTMQVLINNNARFCYQIKEKVLSSNTLRKMQTWTRKGKNGEPYWLRFRKRFVWWVW